MKNYFKICQTEARATTSLGAPLLRRLEFVFFDDASPEETGDAAAEATFIAQQFTAEVQSPSPKISVFRRVDRFTFPVVGEAP